MNDLFAVVGKVALVTGGSRGIGTIIPVDSWMVGELDAK